MAEMRDSVFWTEQGVPVPKVTAEQMREADRIAAEEFGLGMGVILIAVTIGAALFRGTVSGRLRAALPYVHRISALFLMGAGAYLVYYWLFIAGL